jgi:hypothetical protein
MGEDQLGSVQKVAIKRESRRWLPKMMGRSIEGVSNYGMTKRLKMDSDLVGSPGLNTYLNEGEVSISRRMNAFEYFDVRDGGANTFAIGGPTCGHAGTTDQITSDREVDGDVVFGETSMNERYVCLLKLTRGKHLAELAVRAVVFSDDDNATRLLIETVDDAGAEISANLR